MPDFRYGHAAAADWRVAAENCLAQLGSGPGKLGFIYLTDTLSDHADQLLDFFRQRTGIADWVGSVGIGICATGREYLDEPAVAVMVGDFDPQSFAVFDGQGTDFANRDVRLACGSATANFALVHADPLLPDIGEQVSRVAEKVESGFLVGGLTSSRRRNLQVANGIVQGGISGVAFADSVAIATRLTQGCSPVGPQRVVTAGQRNVIVTLDGEPALDVFKRDIGAELSRDLNRVSGHIFAGLPIAGSDTGDYLVRNLVGIDPENKLIAIGEVVEPGTSITFCRRDRTTARHDMARMLTSIGEGLFTRPRGGIYYSCLGRGAGLFGPDSAELRMITDALGEFPLVGFFCNGEISHHRLYGYTGVLTLFV
jgi:small ligand-binding sensory domain FIST